MIGKCFHFLQSPGIILVFLVVLHVACKPVDNHDRNSKIRNAISFQSSDTVLNLAFDWAKSRALSYAHAGGPVGSWYEAALPNREAFCMRDVAHQSTGAAVLGLKEHNLNLLRKFAVNISESKDYCSFWEINRYDKPPPVDYKNDDDFWYNLPANFDVTQACYQQFLWTGDSTYIQDQAFLNFYQLSTNNYVDRWQLGVDKVLHRNRLINIKYPENPDSSFFYDKRGIPTYNEGGRSRTLLGIDMTASLYAGYHAYSRLLKFTGNDSLSRVYQTKANEVKAFLNTFWWDPEKNSYRSVLYEDGSFDHFKVGNNQAFLLYLLHFGVLDEGEKMTGILDRFVAFKDSLIVELASYLPKYFYQYGHAETASELVKKLCDSSNARRDYPENSFAVLDAIATGLMGIKPDASQHLITTISNLPQGMQAAEMDDVSVFCGTIDVVHKGRTSTSLTNNTGRLIQWKACFYGDFSNLLKDGEISTASHFCDLFAREISTIQMDIKPGETITIKIP